MKVTAYKTVEVECEVDVEPEDIVREFGQRAGEASAKYFRRLIEAMDSMTRIMDGIGADVIAAMPERARTVIGERLEAQAARWRK